MNMQHCIFLLEVSTWSTFSEVNESCDRFEVGAGEVKRQANPVLPRLSKEMKTKSAGRHVNMRTK